MSLQGGFEWYTSLKQGGKMSVQFVLRNTNMLMSETFDCIIADASGQQQPQVWRKMKIKARQSIAFNFDTCGWEWSQGDFFAILGKDSQAVQRWDLRLNVPGRANQPAMRDRKISALRKRIGELQAKMEKADWDARMMQRRGTNVSMSAIYREHLELKHSYQREILELQYELQQLESSY